MLQNQIGRFQNISKRILKNNTMFEYFNLVNTKVAKFIKY